MAPHQRAKLRDVSPQSFGKVRVVVVCDMWGEEMKRSMLFHHCTDSTSPCIIFLSNQFDEPKTLSYICDSSVFVPVCHSFSQLCHFMHSFLW